MPQDRIVMCMKWGTLYPADYVNVLFNACRAHITGPFRFVCLTDDTRGFAPGIEAFPIPLLPLRAQDWFSGAWPKLGVFAKELFGLSGRCLFIDLDSVICGALDPFFEVQGKLIVLDGGANWRRGSNGQSTPMVATGVFAFTLGTLGHIVSGFAHDPGGHVSRCELEQAFVGEMVPEATFWPEPWVQSFKRHLRRALLVDRFLPPRSPPPDARIIAFHGEPRPIALLRDGSWARFPRHGRGPVNWVAEYWTRNAVSSPRSAEKAD